MTIKAVKNIDLVLPNLLTPEVVICQVADGNIMVRVDFPRRLSLKTNRTKFEKTFLGFEGTLNKSEVHPSDLDPKSCLLEVVDDNHAVVMDIPNFEGPDFLGELWADPTEEEVVAAGGEMDHPYKVGNVHLRSESINFPGIAEHVRRTWFQFLVLTHMDNVEQFNWLKPLSQRVELSPETCIRIVGLLKGIYEEYSAACPTNPKAWEYSHLPGY